MWGRQIPFPQALAIPQSNNPDSLISPNTLKLSSSFRVHSTSRRQETVSLGSYVIPIAEKGAEASDYRVLGALLRPLFIYF